MKKTNWGYEFNLIEEIKEQNKFIRKIASYSSDMIEAIRLIFPESGEVREYQIKNAKRILSHLPEYRKDFFGIEKVIAIEPITNSNYREVIEIEF